MSILSSLGLFIFFGIKLNYGNIIDCDDPDGCIFECNDPNGCQFDCSDINCNANILICWDKTPKCEIINCDDINCMNINFYSFANETIIDCTNGCSGNTSPNGNKFYCGDSKKMRNILKHNNIITNLSVDKLPQYKCTLKCGNNANKCKNILYQCDGNRLDTCEIEGMFSGTFECSVNDMCLYGNHCDSDRCSIGPPTSSPVIRNTDLTYIQHTNIIDTITWKELIIVSIGIIFSCLCCTACIIFTCVHYKYKMSKLRYSKQTNKSKRNQTSNFKSDSNDLEINIPRPELKHPKSHLQRSNAVVYTSPFDVRDRDLSKTTNLEGFEDSLYNHIGSPNNINNHNISSPTLIPNSFNSDEQKRTLNSLNINNEVNINNNYVCSKVKNCRNINEHSNKSFKSNSTNISLPVQIKSRVSSTKASHHYIPEHEFGTSRTITQLKDIQNILSNDKLIEYNNIKYDRNKIIGAGNFGNVYIGEYNGKTVAIKVYNSNQKRSNKDFYSESVIASDLKHENLVNIIGYCFKPLKCILMTYVDGYNLREYCYQDKMDNKWNNCHQYIIIYLKVLKGLMFMHRNSIIHRDIAARNILVNIKNGVINDNTEVRLIDFGSARHLYRDKIDNENVQSNTYSNYGPIKWMAPEAIQLKKYSIQTDTYMFGMAMYEIFYRIEPYYTLTNIQVALGLILNEIKLEFPPKKLLNKKQESIPNKLKILIESCTCHDPRNRISTDMIRECLTKINEYSESSLNEISSSIVMNKSVAKSDNDMNSFNVSVPVNSEPLNSVNNSHYTHDTSQTKSTTNDNINDNNINNISNINNINIDVDNESVISSLMSITTFTSCNSSVKKQNMDTIPEEKNDENSDDIVNIDDMIIIQSQVL